MSEGYFQRKTDGFVGTLLALRTNGCFVKFGTSFAKLAEELINTSGKLKYIMSLGVYL